MTFKHDVVIQPSLTTSDGTTQDFTVSGFGTPRAWIVTVLLPATEDSRSDGSTLGIGFCETSDNVSFDRTWLGQTLQDGATSSIFAGDQNDTAEARAFTVSSTASDELRATGQTITDGIRLTYTTRPTTALTVRVDLIDCDDAAVSSRSATGSSASINIGFQPNAGFTIHSAELGSPTSGHRPSLGFVGEDSGGNVTQCSIASQHASTSTSAGARVGQRMNSAHFMGRLTPPSFTETTWEIDSLDATGYTYTQDVGSGTLAFGELWIRADGIEFHAEAVSTPTSTGAQSYTNAGFQAAGGWFGATFLDTLDTNESTGGCGTFGFGSWSSDEGCAVGVTEDAADPSNASSYASSSALCLLGDDGTVGVEGRPSGVASGYSIDFTTVDTTARYFMALVYSASDALSAVDETEGLTEEVSVALFGPSVDESVGMTEEVGTYFLTMQMVTEDDVAQGSFPGPRQAQASSPGVEEAQGVD